MRAPSTKRNGRSRLCYLMAPRLRPLLTPPNDGTQKGNRLFLRVAQRKGAGHLAEGREVLACIAVQHQFVADGGIGMTRVVFFQRKDRFRQGFGQIARPIDFGQTGFRKILFLAG